MGAYRRGPRSSSLIHESHVLFRARMQRGILQHEAFQAPRARVDRLQEGPTLSLLLEMVAGSGERPKFSASIYIHTYPTHTWCASSTKLIIF